MGTQFVVFCLGRINEKTNRVVSNCNKKKKKADTCLPWHNPRALNASMHSLVLGQRFVVI